MMLDEKLIGLLEFYTGVAGAEKLPDEEYRLPAMFFKRTPHYNENPAVKHAAWMAREMAEKLKHLSSLTADAQRGVSFTHEGMLTLRTKNIISQREKAHRWLGFIQGVLWMAGIFSLDELKTHSHKCSDDYKGEC